MIVFPRLTKSVLRRFWIRFRSFLISNFRPGKNLIFVHIGKCGGATLSKSIKMSPLIAGQYSHVERVHIRKPPIMRGSHYLVAVRNPISRAISAFNWRYHKVVETQEQRGRFPGEFEVLQKYQTLNNLAEELYQGESLNVAVAKEFLSIHHLRESIAFYLEKLLGGIQPNQIFAVAVTEFLDSDIRTFLGVQDSEVVHEHRTKVGSEQLFLSNQAQKNLAKFLELEFKLLDQLCRLGSLAPDKKEVLLSGYQKSRL